MSKRFYYPQQQGERKKAKLNITISDHNFPLSQNNDNNKDNNIADNWGDDNDDEILLLASQVCEQAYSDNTISLPDYSMCMQPSSTSTQIYEPAPSTSKSTFSFKKPTTNALNIISTKLKDKCELISSPLPGISKDVQKMHQVNLVEDMIFNDKIYKGDTDYVYRQLLQLQEENSKLKSENGKLLEKCVTKEGEVSILRTQLKTSQATADNARLEKIKVQEKAQMEWTEKLTAANKQLQDLMTQLDFKNLEITSIKEKCRMLESSKVKLTQVTVPRNDISSSPKHNSSSAPNDSVYIKRFKSVSKNIQTDERISDIHLSLPLRRDHKKLIQLLPLTLETSEEQHSILDYNDKLQRQTDIPNGCKVFSTFYRIPNTPHVSQSITNKVVLSDIYENLAFIASDQQTAEDTERYLNIFRVTRLILKEVECQLETLLSRATTAFLREMDEKYIEATSSFHEVTDEDLISGKPLYKEEQAITARRVLAIFSHILEYDRAAQILDEHEQENSSMRQNNSIIELIYRICVLIDKMSSAIPYGGLLHSALIVLKKENKAKSDLIMKSIKCIITSRPPLNVACYAMKVLRKMASISSQFCSGRSDADLALDNEQGLLLFKNDSCFLQVLAKQLEVTLRCLEKQRLKECAMILCRDLILFCANLKLNLNDGQKSRCGCGRALLQVTVAALRLCAIFTTTPENAETAITISKHENGDRSESELNSNLRSVCLVGLQLLYQCAVRDPELCPLLGYDEGHLIHFCEIVRTFKLDDLYGNMLIELSSTWQAPDGSTGQEDSAEIGLEEAKSTNLCREPWVKSFKTFLTAD